jgi:hypothetical protein
VKGYQVYRQKAYRVPDVNLSSDGFELVIQWLLASVRCSAGKGGGHHREGVRVGARPAERRHSYSNRH